MKDMGLVTLGDVLVQAFSRSDKVRVIPASGALGEGVYRFGRTELAAEEIKMLGDCADATQQRNIVGDQMIGETVAVPVLI